MSAEDDPVGWQVTLLQPQPEKLTGTENREPYHVSCKTKQEADDYKRLKQSQGWVASVTPVFLLPQQRGKLRNKRQQQLAPPDRNHDWRLHGDKK